MSRCQPCWHEHRNSQVLGITDDVIAHEATTCHLVTMPTLAASLLILQPHTLMNHELLPAIPSPLHLWRSLRPWVGVAYVLLIFRAAPALIVDFWFLDSVGQAGVFWTNFTVQALLFGIGLALFTLAVSVPLRRYATSPGLRSAGIHLGLWIGTLGG